MDKNYSIFDAAHKGDFEFVSNKLEEDPNLLHQRDSVSNILYFYKTVRKCFIYRIKER